MTETNAETRKRLNLRSLILLFSTGAVVNLSLLTQSKLFQTVSAFGYGVALGMFFGNGLGGRKGAVIGGLFAFVFLSAYASVVNFVLKPLLTPTTIP